MRMVNLSDSLVVVVLLTAAALVVNPSLRDVKGLAGTWLKMLKHLRPCPPAAHAVVKAAMPDGLPSSDASKRRLNASSDAAPKSLNTSSNAALKLPGPLSSQPSAQYHQQQQPPGALTATAGFSLTPAADPAAACSLPPQPATPAALLVVDMQPCFLPGGALPTHGGQGVISHINQLLEQGGFQRVVYTQDWHPPGHVSFESTWQHILKQQQQQQEEEEEERAEEQQQDQQHRCQQQQPPPAFDAVQGGCDPEVEQLRDQLQQPCKVLNLTYTRDGKLCGHVRWFPGHAVQCAAPEGTAPAAGASAATGSDNSSSSSGSNSRSSSSRRGGADDNDNDRSTPSAAKLPEGVHTVQQVLWPDHCIQGTPQAQLHPDLMHVQGGVVVRKGAFAHLDAYSAFYDNGHFQGTGLQEALQKEGVQQVFVTGLALEYCVLATALDAAAAGFEVVLVRDATAAVDSQGGSKALEQLAAAGVKLVNTTAQALQLRQPWCAAPSW